MMYFVPQGCFNLSKQWRPWWNAASCCISLRVFTVCFCTRLGVFSIQRVYDKCAVSQLDKKYSNIPQPTFTDILLACASSEGSGEISRKFRLACNVDDHLCDKHKLHIIICSLKCVCYVIPLNQSTLPRIINYCKLDPLKAWSPQILSYSCNLRVR